MSEWIIKKMNEIVTFNPKETLKKGALAKKVAMDMLKPFYRDIPTFELTEFNGGTKFRNGDTIMARITPCLENGKIAKVSFLEDNEIGFGSTEYIVFRAIDGISNADYIYYLVCSPFVRNPAIKSMVGSSGRQRVQTDVLQNLEIALPDLETQKRIASLLSAIDDKIELNTAINENLEQQAQAIFEQYIIHNTNQIKNGMIGDYCSVMLGYAFKSSWQTDKGIRVIKIKTIDNNGLNLSECSFVSADKMNISSEFSVTGGDILIAMTGATIGKFAVVPRYYEPLLVNQRVGKFFLGDNPIDKLPFLF